MSYDKKLPDVSECLVYEERFIDPTLPTGLWFCEDAESVQAVGVNAVSLSLTANWNDLYKCAEFINLFPYVLIVAANKEKRRQMVEELRERLTYISLLVAPQGGFKGCTTVAELKGACGQKTVNELLIGAVELPAFGMVALQDVEAPETWKMPRALSGIAELDRSIGGFLMGELSIWTGKRGEGKSTLANQLLLQAVDQGHKVCAYSGELTAWRFKEWALLQAAGPNYLTSKEDGESGRVFYSVPPHIKKRIDEWWENSFFLYDLGIATAHDEDSIMDTFALAHRRYGCDVFLVDNIMTTRFKGTKDADFYRAQSNFTGRLVGFAKKHGVHVHLVAHPRKATGRNLEADDVGGAGDITNRADNVFSIKRMPEGKEYGTLLSVLKNRAFGNQVKIGLDFEPSSRRFYKAGTGDPTWRFGWEHDGGQIVMRDEPVEGDPFEEVANAMLDH